MLLAIATANAQEMPADYKAVLSALGKTGDFKEGVLKVALQETPWVTGNPPIRETAGHHGANRPEPE